MSSPPHARTVIAVMARSPLAAPHTIKTRLRGVVADDRARAALYRAFLSDTIALARWLSAAVPGATLRVAYTPEGGSVGFSELGVDNTELLPQRGDDLGAREQALFFDLFASGAAHAIVMGSDVPTLPPRVLPSAVETLQHDPATVVLGPSTDGGYYAIGLSSPAVSGCEIPDVFSGIRWSTSHTLADTRSRAAALGRGVTLLPEWFDVDDEDGWGRLTDSLRDPAVAARAHHTAAAVAAVAALKPTPPQAAR